ncbi:MAG: GTP cyclohydrolase [Opitutales bacterium]
MALPDQNPASPTPAPPETEAASHEEHPDVRQVVDAFEAKAFRIEEEGDFYERPIYGTTLYLANIDIDTRFGPFRAYVFQDIIHKGYVIALAYGDIHHADTLYTRLHSSCVTSETLRGCDCDCVEQLEGAFERIAEKGVGILFYLMQEGRGVGYVSKARDRMLVQATNDGISTFQAYATLGLQKDYRDYRNIRDICHLMKIDAGFIVLTNNPDKVDSMKKQGLEVKGTETIEYDPGPFNLAYLTSKAEAGHILSKPQMSEMERIIPPEPVVPFKPYALKDAQRFVYSASYFLPVKPINGEIILTEDEFQTLFSETHIDAYIEREVPLVKSYRLLRNNRFLVQIRQQNLRQHRQDNPGDPIGRLLVTPYWFRVHVYFDIVTGQDFVVLTHNQPKIYDTPVVRIQSESLTNRFPVKDMDNRDKYKKAISHIVRYGVGVIILMYDDGRGAGFGAMAADRMLTETNRSFSSDESYRKLGVSYDSRDYMAALTLLRQHLASRHIQMIMNSPSSLVRKREYAEALDDNQIEVDRWIFLEKDKI